MAIIELFLSYTLYLQTDMYLSKFFCTNSNPDSDVYSIILSVIFRPRHNAEFVKTHLWHVSCRCSQVQWHMERQKITLLATVQRQSTCSWREMNYC